MLARGIQKPADELPFMSTLSMRAAVWALRRRYRYIFYNDIKAPYAKVQFERPVIDRRTEKNRAELAQLLLAAIAVDEKAHGVGSAAAARLIHSALSASDSSDHAG